MVNHTGSGSLTANLKESIGAVDRVLTLTEPLIKAIRSGELAETWLDEVARIMVELDAMRSVFDSNPLGDGTIPAHVTGSERALAERQFPELIEKLQKLSGHEAAIHSKLKSSIDEMTGKMTVVRKARKIFSEFVREPQQAPRFFDKNA